MQPQCRCYGVLVAVQNTRIESSWLIGRNAVLMTLLGFGVFGATRGASSDPARPPAAFPGRGRSVNSPTGFTLIELVCVLGVLAALMLILAPSLASARQAANALRALSDLRSHVAVLTSYTADYDDQHPFIATPGATLSVARGGGVSIAAGYFWISSLAWNIALADQYYEGHPRQESFYPPGWISAFHELVGAPVHPLFAGYHYSCNFAAAPAYWNRQTRMSGASQLRSTRGSEVRYPSKKIMLSSFFPWLTSALRSIDNAEQAPTCVGLTDGSARICRGRDTLPQYFNGDGHSIDVGHTGPFQPGLHTVDGLYGRDLP